MKCEWLPVLTMAAIGLSLTGAGPTFAQNASPAAQEPKQSAPGVMLEGTATAPVTRSDGGIAGPANATAPAAPDQPVGGAPALSVASAAPAARPPAVAAAVPTFRRRYQLRGGIDFGWNSLTGLGVVFSGTPIAHIEVDAGAGLSALGYRAGTRLRLTPMTGSFRPFIGGGLSMSAGTFGRKAKLDTDDNKIEFKVKPAPYAQLVVGFEAFSEEGWLFLLAAGRAFALRDGNYEVVSGTPNKTQNDVLELLYGSGAAISLEVGKRF